MSLRLENLEPLSKHLLKQSAHLQTILQGSVASLSQTSNPLRYSNTALGLRELLRELFALLSPDDSIEECSWFKPDETSKTGVTRKHRILFAVYSYLNPAHYPKNFVSGVEKLAISDKADPISGLGNPLGGLTSLCQELLTDPNGAKLREV
jgi:hypothetical protein